MRYLLVMFAAVVPSVASAAPAKDPPPPPYAILDFFGSPKAWDMTLELTTVSGASYELQIGLDDNQSNAFRYDAQRQFIRANWCAEMSGDRSIHIYGVRTKEGKADAVKTLVLTNRVRRGMGRTPELREGRDVKVETRTDDKEPPARTGKRPLPGPVFKDEAFVEFDMTPLPENLNKIKLYLRIDTTDPSQYVKEEFGGLGSREDFSILVEMYLNQLGYKAEVVEKTKVRVYGNTRENRFYPVTKGSAECEQLETEALPKVTNPKKKP